MQGACRRQSQNLSARSGKDELNGKETSFCSISCCLAGTPLAMAALFFIMNCGENYSLFLVAHFYEE